MSRPWLALVLILFCAPLFIGLRSLDLETDEAIYSFAVDRILEVGEWLQPKSSPSETSVFLEKPPLKFWIVAAPIKAGLLPHDEFGLRFWDALFGAVAFAYVFAIGCRLAGPVCGFVAVLLLFVHEPLIFNHGLRTNNMEGPLFLAYCGGMFHALRWAAADARQRLTHAVAFALYFVLGFMTKFVAAIFLPASVALAFLLHRSTRQRLAADWRRLAVIAGLSLLLILPWFIYAYVIFGSELLHTMFAEHVYARFSTGLNPEHVHPWNWYVLEMTKEFTKTGIGWLIPIGLVILLVQTIRRRSLDGTIVMVWATVPLMLISSGSSKLYHYAFPFLPPLTLAAGYVVGLVVTLAPVVLRKLLEFGEDVIAGAAPRLSAAAAKPWIDRVADVLIWAGGLLAAGAILFDSVRVGYGSTVLFKSSGLVRPCLAMIVAGLLARRSGQVALPLVALVVAAWMPVNLYKDSFHELSVQRHPIRDARDCIMRVQASLGDAAPRGLFVDTDSSMWHPIYYYLRQVRPWTRQERPSAEAFARTLHDSSELRPSLVQEFRYRDYFNGPDAARFGGNSPPLISLFEYELVLPGPYGACSPEARLHTSQ